MPTTLTDQGKCASCQHQKGLAAGYVKCRSKAHARFMDICGADNYQQRRKNSGFLLLKSAEEVGMSCPSWEAAQSGKRGGQR